MRVRLATAAAGCLTVVAACGPARPGSDGSRLDGPRVWSVSAGPAPGASEWVDPGGALGEGALSITILASASDRTRLVIGVVDDGDRVWVDPDRPERSPNRVLGGRGLLVGMIPTATASLGLARNYRVGAFAPEAAGGTTVSISVWTKRAPAGRADVRAQELPVTVYLVGEGRRDDAALAVALGEVGRIWRAAGIEVLEPRRVRIGGTEGARFEHLDIVPELGSDSPQLGDLLQLSGGAEVESAPLALFLVGDITTGPGASIWALSGGVPVPPVLGTIRSGIAVNAAIVELDPVHAGQVMAHEIGHALGLYHTTERDLVEASAGAPREPIHDQIDDSPACPAASDTAPADGLLSSAECQAADAANLMFWSAAKGATRLTAGQSDIARRSPLVR